MKAPLVIVAAILSLPLAVISCSASEEEVAPSGISLTPSPAQASSTAPTPSPVPPTSPDAVPADWHTYADPDGLFSIRYPENWFQTADQPQFSSYDLSKLTTTKRPPEALVVEVAYSTAAGITNCGGLSVDPKSGEGSPDPGATPMSLGGVPAWQIARTEGDPALEGDLTRAESISVIYEGYCLVVAGYFTQQAPDVSTFLQIARSFKFTF